MAHILRINAPDGEPIGTAESPRESIAWSRASVRDATALTRSARTRCRVVTHRDGAVSVSNERTDR